MKKIVLGTKYKKDIKVYKHNKSVLDELKTVLLLLENGNVLPAKYDPHPLKGQYKGCIDCHIKPDVVLIYEVREDSVGLVRIGKHNKLGLTESALKLHIEELED